MIKKLLAYDFRGVGKKLMPLYILAIVFALLTRFTFTNHIMRLGSAYNSDGLLYSSSAQSFLANSIMGLIMGLTWIIIVAIFVVTFFMITAKYYRSIYGDEGYLTNTLPISPSQILITKVLNFYIWNAIGIVISLIAVFIMFFDVTLYGNVLSELKEGFAQISVYFTSREYTAVVIFIIAYILAPVAGILFVYFCAAIASRSKYKIAMGIATYIGINFVVSTFNQIVVTMIFTPYFNGSEMEGLYDFPLLGLSIYALIFVSIQVVGFFFANKYFLTNHLNLE